MAGWGDNVGTGKRFYKYRRSVEVAVLIYIVSGTSVLTSYAQQDGLQTDWLSLDCGGAQGAYEDSRGIRWKSDDDYISTGKSSSKQLGYPSDMQALENFRYFPGDRSKYCYDVLRHLSVPNQYGSISLGSLLVRASFYLDQSEFAARKPFEFIVSLDANDWFTIKSDDATSQSLLVVQEAIFFLTDSTTHNFSLCLRAVSGVPFISSLEQRWMDGGIGSTTLYSSIGDTSKYLALSVRYNCGAKNASDIRYPADQFDRIWRSPDASVGTDLVSFNGTSVYDYSVSDSANNVPPEVMQDAWLFATASASLNISPVFANGPQVYTFLNQYYAYAILYSQDLNTTTNGTYSINICLDSDWGHGNMIAQPTILYASPHRLSQNSIIILLGNDNVWPSLNAVEVYGQVTYNFSITNSVDASIINALKTAFSLMDWQGDPCVPVPYNWLSCRLTEQTHQSSFWTPPVNHSTSATVTSLNISDINNTNFSSILGNPVNLSSEGFIGLNTMSITNSGVDDQALLFLLNFAPRELITLNLSYNSIMSLPQNWGGNWQNDTLNSLVTLDLSYNQLAGDMSSLDEWIQLNSGSLQELNISHNQLNGTFSSELYFSGLTELAYANFDHNSIEGILNLSTWYSALQEAVAQFGSKNSTLTPVTRQLYSFLNNRISSIFPSAADFDPTIYKLFKNNPSFGVLLNGNPYCNNIKSNVQGYLCRSSISEAFEDDPVKKSTTEILIFAICGGVVAFLLTSITSVSLWKLWKQVHALRSVQQALADRKIQPPFYHYSDLKTATKNFLESNKLGQGGFGVVYKADYPDETLAVKKLFTSKNLQVLDEFLNEVVLITGIKHRNLVQLKGCCIRDRERMLVYEYAENGNLAEALWGLDVMLRLNWRQRKDICIGVARGLSYLHEELQPSIIHRDIKPQNILLDKDFKPKIADFGLARHFSNQINEFHYTQIAGTLGYFAPEYATQGQVSDKTDVYSYGILILEVISGRKCIELARPEKERYLKNWVLYMRKNSFLFDVLQPELRDDCDAEEVVRAINIALLCVQNSPERRPTMSQVVTMFLGNMSLELIADDIDDSRSIFTELIAAAGQESEQFNHHCTTYTQGESPPYPRLGLDSSSFFPKHELRVRCK